MAITMSTAAQNDRPPAAGADQSAAMSTRSSRRQVSHPVVTITAHSANFVSHSRTTATGPQRPSAITAPPNARIHTHAASSPVRLRTTALAAWPMMASSNTVQPRSWTTLTAVATYEPPRPSAGRRQTIVGSPVWLPTMPVRPSSVTPITLPTRMAPSACGSESAGTRKLPARRTRSPIPRSPQSTKNPQAPSRRDSAATGPSFCIAATSVVMESPPSRRAQERRRAPGMPSALRAVWFVPTLVLPRSGSGGRRRGGRPLSSARPELPRRARRVLCRYAPSLEFVDPTATG